MPLIISCSCLCLHLWKHCYYKYLVTKNLKWDRMKLLRIQKTKTKYLYPSTRVSTIVWAITCLSHPWTTQTAKHQQQENKKSSERKEFTLSWCTSRNCPFGWWNHGKMILSLFIWITSTVIPIWILLIIFPESLRVPPSTLQTLDKDHHHRLNLLQRKWKATLIL